MPESSGNRSSLVHFPIKAFGYIKFTSDVQIEVINIHVDAEWMSTLWTIERIYIIII